MCNYIVEYNIEKGDGCFFSQEFTHRKNALDFIATLTGEWLFLLYDNGCRWEIDSNLE